MRISIAGLVFSLTFAVAGCGGGGGSGGGSGPDPITHQVSVVAGAGGSVSPGTQSVTHGATATLRVTADSGYEVESVSGCRGSLIERSLATLGLDERNQIIRYTTGAITQACTVNASFVRVQYAVSATASSGGSINPSNRSVTHGDTTTFTVTPDTGYSTGSVTGCDGTLSGTTYTTGPITEACTVNASFDVIRHQVDAYADVGGTIDPASRTVSHGETAEFSVSPETGYGIAAVTGCDGVLDGTTYTTGPITGACTVNASFVRTHTVTAYAGPEGSISPASQTVIHGDTTTFVVTPDSGYRIASVSGCPGSLVGNSYFTAPITEACTVVADFAASVGGGSGSNLAPELVSATSVGTSTAALSWLPANTEGSASIRYTVHLSDTPEFVPDSSNAVEEVTDQLFAQLTGLTPDQRYYAKISVPHPDSDMIWSNELSFVTGSIPTVLDPTQDFDVIAASDVMSIEEDRLYLANTSGLAAGSILVSDTGGGLFRRIVSVDDTTGRVVTTNASLNELFEDLHLSSETRLATLPSTPSTEILRLQTLTEDMGERREFHWPETGLRLMQDKEPSPRSPDSLTPMGGSTLMLPQSTDSWEMQSPVNNRIRIRAPLRVVAEPGSLLQFDVVADLVNDAAMAYEIT